MPRPFLRVRYARVSARLVVWMCVAGRPRNGGRNQASRPPCDTGKLQVRRSSELILPRRFESRGLASCRFVGTFLWPDVLQLSLCPASCSPERRCGSLTCPTVVGFVVFTACVIGLIRTPLVFTGVVGPGVTWTTAVVGYPVNIQAAMSARKVIICMCLIDRHYSNFPSWVWGWRSGFPHIGLF